LTGGERGIREGKTRRQAYSTPSNSWLPSIPIKRETVKKKSKGQKCNARQEIPRGRKRGASAHWRSTSLIRRLIVRNIFGPREKRRWEHTVGGGTKEVISKTARGKLLDKMGPFRRKNRETGGEKIDMGNRVTGGELPDRGQASAGRQELQHKIDRRVEVAMGKQTRILGSVPATSPPCWNFRVAGKKKRPRKKGEN